MEEPNFSIITDGEVTGIRFGLASHQEICTASVNGTSISHASQLSNPYLGLPLEFGRCEACGTSEPGKCEGHFGYIELPIAIYHPSHVLELKRMLSLLCIKCLKMKKNKFPVKSAGIADQLLSSCCQDASQVSIDVETKDGCSFLQLKVPAKKPLQEGFWNFLERYGFRYSGSCGEVLSKRPLLPCEVQEILKRIPDETRKKLVGKGYFTQDGYVLQCLPVAPNCLSVPEISDGTTIMSTDPSTTMLKKVLKQVEIIRSSRSAPNFESVEVESHDLQSAVDQYLQVRGTVKASRDIEARFGVNKEGNSSTKLWLEKMRTLFIRKGSGFSSRTVITGDAYKAVNEVGIPFEIAQRITFEERVTRHNIGYLQELVDNKLCLMYKDGSTTYSLREGSKGFTFLKPGQVVHRRIMDGDTVFVNRPPTTHKHSLQALKVYVHDDNTVKINPLICGPLSADFDGDCVHLFYPQSLMAKAEVMELFSLEKQLLSSHNGTLILQLASDALLSLKMMFKRYFMDKIAVQQLALFASSILPEPALLKGPSIEPYWTASQIIQTALPPALNCSGDRFLIRGSDILVLDFNRDVIPSVINEIVTCICFEKDSEEVLKFFNSLQPMLMENIFREGFSVGLEDFSISQDSRENIQREIQVISPLLYHLRSTYNELVDLQLENHIRSMKVPVTHFILKSTTLGDLIDSKSDSAINKAVQQIGFLGLQISDRGKFYSKTLVEDVSVMHNQRYPENIDYPSAEYGLIKGCFFHGLDPYEEMVHSISTREVIVRSSRGLTEPGTLFKNLMAILRDVVICYDGTIRNICSNSIIQFEYGGRAKNLYPAGEPVGVLAATAMSNPAYKAVLDSTPSSNSSWELMKEILLCKVSFKNDLIDRRVILYLNGCDCGRKYCRENAAYLVKNQLKRVSLKDTAVEFLIEYKNQPSVLGSEINAGLVGHLHLNKTMLKEMNVGMSEILEKCQDTINSFRKKKKVAKHLKKTVLSFSECCLFNQCGSNGTSEVPCLLISGLEETVDLEDTSHVLADVICPVLLETIIKGDSRISSANITWINPDTTTWIRNPQHSENGELALDVVLEKSAVKQSGDAWRIVLNSCLPVLHLVDTRRSIPYGIKEIQELLGVSCAFDQAVQRLSTSVSKVAKGVLKEHLILLVNSMTCAGNLVGFNSGGYKALSRSLNVQVPFTEATLITPKKCFERAAEKCHVDTLTSIVASCSWGKHVAVGTGSRFDILWDTKQAELNQEGGEDVYSFLHTVSTACNDESTSACLGAEVDDILSEDDIKELSPSREVDFDSDKPIFEDIVEIQDSLVKEKKSNDWQANPNRASENDWSATGASDSGSKDANCSSNGWDIASTGTKTLKDNAWSGWVIEKSEKKDVSTNPLDELPKHSCRDSESNLERKVDDAGGSTWRPKTDDAGGFGWQREDEDTYDSGRGRKAGPGWGRKEKDAGGSSLGRKEEDAGGSPWERKAENAGGFNWGSKEDDASGSAWEIKTKDAGGSSWGRAEKDAGGSSWGRMEKDAGGSSWGRAEKDAGGSSWGRGEKDAVGSSWGRAEKDVGGSSWGRAEKDAGGSSWGRKGEDAGGSSWGRKEEDAGGSSWGRMEKDAGGSSWGRKEKDAGGSSLGRKEEGAGGSPWERKAENAGGFDWGSKEEDASGSAWEIKTKDAGGPSLGRKADDAGGSSWRSEEEGSSKSGWGSKTNNAGGLGWGNKVENPSLPVEYAESPIVNSSWGKQMSPETSQGWSSQSLGYGNDTEIRGECQSGESYKKPGVESSRGWGRDAGDWKIKKNRPNKVPWPGMMKEDLSQALFTATRQRLDTFTSEEQDSLSLVEPIMKSIRQIMHKPGYVSIF
ncbi:hypothetical protein UlMin_027006 [Ulmus minor]